MMMVLGPTKNAGVKRDAESEDESAERRRRFKVTGTGKMLRRHAMQSHNLDEEVVEA